MSFYIFDFAGFYLFAVVSFLLYLLIFSRSGGYFFLTVFMSIYLHICLYFVYFRRTNDIMKRNFSVGTKLSVFEQ